MLDAEPGLWFHPQVPNNDDDSKASRPPDKALSGLNVAMVVRIFSPRGGLELYTHKLVEGLLLRGLKITVICQENESDFRHELLSFVHVEKPDKSFSKSEKLRHYSRVSTLALQENGPFDIVHSQHHPVDRPDVVTFHNHTVARLNLVGLRWEAALNSVKTALTSAYRTRDEFDRALSTRAAVRIFTSRTCAHDFYRTYDLGDAPYVVAYPGAALDAAPPAALAKNYDGTFTFLFVGKGFRKKGLDVLFKAMSLLIRDGSDARLLIAGLKERPLDKLRKLRLGLRPSVIYLGFRNDMDRVYDSAHAIVLPSRIEPFGMAPLQGMLYGLVPLVSKVSGVSEILSNGEDSLILENHLDAHELASHMHKLMEDKTLTAKLAHNARRTAESVKWDRCVNETIESYKIALSAREREQSASLSNR